MEKLGYFFLLCGGQGNYENSLLYKKKHYYIYASAIFMCCRGKEEPALSASTSKWEASQLLQV